MAEYPFPWDLLAGLALALPSGRRSFVDDCREAVSRISPPPVVRDADFIPTRGPVVVMANHYQRRGLWIGWPGAVITAAVADRRGSPPIHWLVTGGLRWCQWQQRGPQVPFTRLIFDAVARTYGMAALPLAGSRERAGAIRTWLRWGGNGEPLGIFPEGLEGRSNGLRAPEPGFNNLVHLLGRREVTFLPCGIFERSNPSFPESPGQTPQSQGPVLHVAFGHPLSYGSEMRTDPGNRIMEAIASLLPLGLRGPYGGVEAPAVPFQPPDDAVAGG